MTTDSARSQDTSEIRILHVDDQPSLTELASVYLKREDERFSIETAHTTTEARELLEARAFDCILCDYDMPGETGIEFLEFVRERYRDIPFILFTGKGSEEIASDAISAGVTDYLQKESGTSQYSVLANRINNVASQYRARTALEASENRLSLIIDHAPFGFLEFDREYEIVRVNNTAEDILGYSSEELCGENLETIVATDSNRTVAEVFGALSANDGGFRSVNENIRKDGTVIVCEWHNRVVTDAEGEVIAYFSMCQDITERRDRQVQLELSSARLEALFVNSPDMVNVHDSNGQIIDANPMFFEKTGYDEDDLGDLVVWDLDETLSPEEAATLWEGMDVGDQRRIESSYRCRGGHSLPVEVHVRRLDLVGEDRFVAISRDITERKERERALEAQNKRLEEFVSVVSHDLRNPLSVATGWMDIIAADYDSDEVESVQRAHRRMETLIDDLLTLARNNEHERELEHIDFGRFVQACAETVDTADATIRSDVQGTITANRSRLQQLLENLLRNAIDHGGEQVTITVGELPNGFYVEDDGDGIDPEDQQNVFEMGFTTASDGTGFGLTIVSEVAAEHDWDVSVTSGSLGGARFEITGVDVEK
ncbi:PAS domain S-box protein [Haloferax namakaokahaiae]|uniref:histidine kinase n=1 Tax=Haloferax namakaokahaiae TaxID=1748331 RepID=A0ABD5ZDC9_9EURY